MVIPAEISIGGVLVPRILLCAVLGFAAAYLLINVLQRRGWSRFLWHLPICFIALWTIFTLLLELLCLHQ